MALLQGLTVFPDDDGDLDCPCCGCSWLHQFQVESWFRPEDSETATHTISTRKETHIDSSNDRNPSRRRDGIVISFRCEECAAIPKMAIFQHKGATSLRWLDVPDQVMSYDYE